MVVVIVIFLYPTHCLLIYLCRKAFHVGFIRQASLVFVTNNMFPSRSIKKLTAIKVALLKFFYIK